MENNNTTDNNIDELVLDENDDITIQSFAYANVDSSTNSDNYSESGSEFEIDDSNNSDTDQDISPTNENEDAPMNTKVRFMSNSIKSKIQFYENNDKYIKNTHNNDNNVNNNKLIREELLNNLQQFINDVANDNILSTDHIKIDMNDDNTHIDKYSNKGNISKIQIPRLPLEEKVCFSPLPPLPHLPSCVSEKHIGLGEKLCFSPLPPYPIMTTSSRRVIIGENRASNEDNNKDNNRLHTCKYCSSVFDSKIYLTDHLLTMHYTSKYPTSKYNKYETEYDENEPCRCTKCGLVCNGDYEYKKHICSGQLSDIDNIPTSINGKFPCPICSNKYSTDNLLGEHFILTHSNFEEYTALDKKEICDGFPGFDILEHIQMIDSVDKSEWHGQMCTICYRYFKNSEDVYNVTDIDDSNLKLNDLLKHNFSDSDLLIYDTPSIDYNSDLITNTNTNTYSYSLKNVFNRRMKVIDDDLVEIINYMRKLEILPYKMICCHTLICNDCLKNNIMISNSITCPFCKRDHENMDLDYIRIYEFNNVIDDNKWFEWRSKY